MVLRVTDENRRNILVCPHCIVNDGDVRYNDSDDRFEATSVMRENLEAEVQRIEQEIAKESHDESGDRIWARLDEDHFFEKFNGTHSYH